MSVNLSNVETAIITELNITRDEAAMYIQIVKNGSSIAQVLGPALGWSTSHADEVAKLLTSRGMVIEISPGKYESLHPRFAVTNRYRRRCEEEGIPFKKNLRVDNIGIVLEKPYEDARTN